MKKCNFQLNFLILWVLQARTIWEKALKMQSIRMRNYFFIAVWFVNWKSSALINFLTIVRNLFEIRSKAFRNWWWSFFNLISFILFIFVRGVSACQRFEKFCASGGAPTTAITFLITPSLGPSPRGTRGRCSARVLTSILYFSIPRVLSMSNNVKWCYKKLFLKSRQSDHYSKSYASFVNLR